jgi:hypothetical protein
MNTFNFQRFMRLCCNDVLWLAKPLLRATLAMMVVGLLIGLTNSGGQQDVYIVLFPIVLLGAGLVFASLSFSDMHHPLQRFHYLTLPCSNLERFVSRYLLSAPLFYLYAVAAYFVFDFILRLLIRKFAEIAPPVFDPLNPMILDFTLAFFLTHALVFTGAIHFRSYTLVKTVLSGALIAVGLALLQLLSVKVFYWDYFPAFLSLEAERDFRLSTPPWLAEPLVIYSVLAAAWVWVMYIAFQCLKDHEVQDAL